MPRQTEVSRAALDRGDDLVGEGVNRALAPPAESGERGGRLSVISEAKEVSIGEQASKATGFPSGISLL